MRFEKKYSHVGYSYPGVPKGWKSLAKRYIVLMEKEMWVSWLPLFVKRLIHRWATGGSIVRIKNKFWYKVRNRLAKGRITDIKEKYGSLRMYCYGTKKMLELEDEVGLLSESTCESCGHFGQDVKQIDNGWVHTLCEKCIENGK